MTNLPDPTHEDNTLESDLNPTPQDIPMEVHHHAPAHGIKKPMDYFWEFLMLFLAVFCGFMAEYQLEHVIEHQREATFMKTLTEDLNMDVKTLTTYSKWRSEVNNDFDSLLFFLSLPDPNMHVLNIHQKANRSIMRFGLPDIRKKEVVSSINTHYLMVSRIRSAFETERLLRVKLVESSADVLNASFAIHPVSKPNSKTTITKDPMLINRFMNMIIASRLLNKNLINGLDSTRVSSLRLKELIGKEYKIETPQPVK
jgi:hypothetical protein